MEQIRSFISIELPDEVKSGLSHLQAGLKAAGRAPVKWVDPYGIHLTLKFLGNIAAGRVGEITGVMEAAAWGISPFHLEVRGLGAFPNLRRVQVVWVGVGGDTEQLSQLQRNIESGLAPLGFAPESREFRPHLTIARLREQASPEERQSFGQLIASTGFEAGFRFGVDAINLMRSQLTPKGAIYTRIGSVRLK